MNSGTQDSLDLAALRYPIGKRKSRMVFSAASRATTMDEIEELPACIGDAAGGLTAAQLDTPYRPGGWTVRQVVHHVADAHLVIYVRARIALTEDDPPVKTWDEVTWAELPDAKAMPIDTSLAIIGAVHARLTHLLRALSPDQFARTMRHPEWGVIPLDELIEICAWHGRHHTAHIVRLRERRGW